MVLFTSFVAYIILTIFIVLCLIIILYARWKFLYWVKVGLPILNPTFPFGNMKNIFFGRCSEGDFYHEYYKKLKANGFKHGGAYMFLHPVYVPTDLEIIKHILQNDFEYFINRTTYLNKENDPLTENIFRMQDDKWKNIRKKMTPTFSSNKLNLMFDSLLDCTEELIRIVGVAAAKQIPLDIKEVLGRFGADVIGAVALGLECNTLKNPESEFNTYCKKFFDIGGISTMISMLVELVPNSLLRMIKFKLGGSELEQFFLKLVDHTVNYRQQNNIEKKDFLQLLLKMKDHDSIHKMSLNMNQITAQVLAFFLASFEAPSTMMTFAFYEMAINPDVQDKVREEINSVLAKHEGQFRYTAFSEMKYLDRVLYETARKYPPGRMLQRRCSRDYTIPNTSICLKKGVIVKISVLGVHHDPEYYPNPEKFDPDRFSEENKRTRPDIAWLAFGKGQRICLGFRFAMLLSKMAICGVLRNYRVGLNAKTKVPIQMDIKKTFTCVKGGVWLDLEKL